MPVAPREVGKVSSVANLTASGAVGAASIDTDVRIILVAQTTASLTLTLPNPTDTSAIVGVDVANTGTAPFMMYGCLVAPSTTIRCVWTGSVWVASSEYPPSYSVANLPTSGVKQGALAYAINGRAMTGVSILGIGGLLFQTAGNGTGVLVTYSGSAWQVAGTATTVAA